MRTRINDHIKEHLVYPCSYTDIHIVDWKKFTNENLKVHDCIPVNPNTGQPVYSVRLKNESSTPILVDAFGENALQYSKKRKARQCECVIYPDNYKETDWVLFVEMKYAESELAAFNSTIFSLNTINDIYLDYGIIIRGTNNAEIVSSNLIKLIG